MEKKIIRIGTRDSKLALIQTQIVVDSIKKFDSNIVTKIVAIKTTGDKILNKTLDKIGGKGLFVKELDEALTSNKIDIAVHSYKDVPMEIDERFPIVAVSKREDVRDVLITRNNQHIAFNSVVGTSSKRRELQLGQLGYSNIKPIRGNLQTRLKKLNDGDFDGIVLAAAGVIRSGMTDLIYKYFDISEILPAACQAVIAVQSRIGEDVSYLSNFNDRNTMTTCIAERAFVRTFNGGCSSPIASYATICDNMLSLTGFYVDEMNNIYKDTIVGNVENAEILGINLANKIRLNR